LPNSSAFRQEKSQKKALADQIGDALFKRMAVEEDIFYPVVEKLVDGAEDVVSEGIAEHAGAKDLIEQIKSMKGDEELFATHLNALNEMTDHHVEKEEKQMFPKIGKSSLDLESLGQKCLPTKRRFNYSLAFRR